MTWGKLVAAVVLGYVALFGVKVPNMPMGGRTLVAPSADMQETVAPVAAVLKTLPMGDRILWANLWEKAAVVAAGDAVTTEVVFTDTRSLRLFTILALDIGWRRIGNHQPGAYKGLREAVEAAMSSVLSLEAKPVTSDVRARYVDVCKAIAWAGLNGG